jgi:hypothetical protein
MPKSVNQLFCMIVIFVFFLTACGRKNTVCPSKDGTPQSTLQLADLIKMAPDPIPSSGPIHVEIRGKLMEVDKIVDYPLCNDDWSGTVYVSCDARVAEAELDADANPLFFKGCNLNIAPNTVVYVAAHNDAAYYKGCSCHTGEGPNP